MAIDYGEKRTGIAVTDPLQIIASPLTTIPSKELISFLKNYLKQENVSLILIGYPLQWNETATHATPLVEQAIQKIKKQFPQLSIQKIDERLSSKQAQKEMHHMHMKKKKRQKKENIDKIAATLLLQEYLNSKSKVL
jgi:putative Holliday junction resolvase